jgi:Glycosyltransferase family 6
VNTVGVVYICTGRYRMFWENFISSAERFFLPSYLKRYFVFTDSLDLRDPRCRVISQKKLGWPYDTLMRFEMISRSKGLLGEMDFLFFVNANMLFESEVNREILPGASENHLVGVQHPGYYKQTCATFPYERDPNSAAHIAAGEGETYYQGCLFGGRSEEFLNLCEVLQRRVQHDLNNGLIATWHDESHLNRFFVSAAPLTLNPGYAYPEAVRIPFEKKIVQLDKARFGGHAFLRGVENPAKTNSVGARTKNLARALRRLWSSLG